MGEGNIGNVGIPRIIYPFYIAVGFGTDIRLGFLVQILEPHLVPAFFIYPQGMPQGDAGHIGMALYPCRFCQITFDKLCRIGTVIKIQHGAQVVYRYGIIGAENVGAIAAQVVHPQGIPLAGDAAHGIKDAFPPAPGGIVTVVIHVQGDLVVIFRLEGRNFIIRSPRLFPGVHQDAQLHVVGSVKTLQLIVQDIRVGHLARFQMDAVGHITLPGKTQAVYGHVAGPAFQQLNLHSAFMDALGGQIGPAHGIALCLV